VGVETTQVGGVQGSGVGTVASGCGYHSVGLEVLTGCSHNVALELLVREECEHCEKTKTYMKLLDIINKLITLYLTSILKMEIDHIEF